MAGKKGTTRMKLKEYIIKEIHRLENKETRWGSREAVYEQGKIDALKWVLNTDTD